MAAPCTLGPAGGLQGAQSVRTLTCVIWRAGFNTHGLRRRGGRGGAVCCRGSRSSRCGQRQLLLLGLAGLQGVPLHDFFVKQLIVLLHVLLQTVGTGITVASKGVSDQLLPGRLGDRDVIVLHPAALIRVIDVGPVVACVGLALVDQYCMEPNADVKTPTTGVVFHLAPPAMQAALQHPQLLLSDMAWSRVHGEVGGETGLGGADESMSSTGEVHTGLLEANSMAY
ncbi:hypothetical protein INR49_011482 [Caranx melampygus]|nr:hypothetical protein INR49_011482 [Caranx melampygus]